ncbi:MAG: leucyl aminopeptidase family protein [Rhizobiaceae bacterium]|nr:leucyl aminopeptidase family protein [Rhizobiaceae bacterium]MCV0405044.1 leucyl aminopeptidase family protein [Rhizobiaceae bacterium]
MPLEFADSPSASSRPIHLVREAKAKGADAAGPIPEGASRWAEANGFRGKPGEFLVLPGDGGGIAGALLGAPKPDDPWAALAVGALARKLPAGSWHFVATPDEPFLAALALRLGSYVFTRYGKKDERDIVFALPGDTDVDRVRRVSDGIFLTRDLINTPANDMGPDQLEDAARKLARKHKARIAVTAGDALLKARLPMIHAVGRAATQAPRLIDLTWGRKDAPKITLVGKGVCFDTGGLDIKPPAGMLLMKKDMGGAANVLGLASMIMAARLGVRLRLLVPAVENAIAGNAFRPGDVLPSRKGVTVEIGNTDAEGRLVLADALALADEEEPELLVDMATLTGAARVALGPELVPFYTPDDGLAADLAAAAAATADPVWRMPLWRPYGQKLSSKIADINNVTSDGFAGSVTAALFLQRFVERTANWVHFDVFGWSPAERPHCPIGGEAQGIRALEQILSRRYRN